MPGWLQWTRSGNVWGVTFAGARWVIEQRKGELPFLIFRVRADSIQECARELTITLAKKYVERLAAKHAEEIGK